MIKKIIATGFSLLKKKEVNNAGWMIGGRICQMLLSLVVSMITARYLGPSNYGLINYGLAFCSFFSSLCNLGINSVIIKNFFEHPDEVGTTLGTSIGLKAVSAVLSQLTIFGIVLVIDKDEPTTILIVMLCSISCFFQSFETINFWFQSKYKSKVTSIATICAYIVTSAYKIVLLILQKDVVWFAMASAVDSLVITVFLCLSYRRYEGPRFGFSLPKASQLLKKSYHYILSGMMVAIYMQTDKLMLKQMCSAEQVAYYSTATTVSSVWVFVVTAIIDSLYPTILSLHEKNYAAYERKNRQLYCIVFYLCVAVSVAFTIFARLCIGILYGAKYLPAVSTLRIVSWYTAFSYLGMARNAWIVCENQQKYLKYLYLSASVINVALNWLLIPRFQSCGAAVASLITQVFTSLILPCFFRDLRPNVRLMLQAICFKL